MRLLKKTILVFSVLSSYLLHAEIYVDLSATGLNDGSSWVDAFTDIQTAVDFAIDNDTVLIAEGIYMQGTEILINKSLTIRGGYPTGGGVQNTDNNTTVIDGDNSHRVIKATHNTGSLYLEGISIQNGKLSGGSSARGAGINTVGDLQLNQVIINNNSAASIAISTAAYSYGGGIYANGAISLTNSLVSNNMASSFSTSSDAVSASGGGGIYTNGTISITNSQINNNTASSSATTNAAFSSSSSFSYGGGINANGIITLTNSVVSNNMVSSSATSAHSSEFSDSRGGGIFGATTLQNSILWGNLEIEIEDESITTNGINEHENGTLTTSHSLIKGQDLSSSNGVDATVADFAVNNFINADTGNFGLTANSVLRNMGNNAFLPADTYDVDNDGNTTEPIPLTLNGTARVVDGTVDIGVFESDFNGKDYNSSATAYFFDANNTSNTQDGLSWTTAFSSLNDYFYIHDSSTVTDIYLAQGNYKTTGTLEFLLNTSINGGYNAATGNAESGKKSSINGQFNGRVIKGHQDITLINTKITNGLLWVYTTNTAVFSSKAIGGGILAEGNIMLTNSQISNNTTSANTFDFSFNANSESYGGGLYANGSTTLTNSQVSNNTASSTCFSSDTSTFPSAKSSGGGIYSSGPSTLTNSQISNNQAKSFSSSFSPDSFSYSSGGGIYGATTLHNSILWANKEIEIEGGVTTVDDFNEHEFGGLTANHSLIKGQDLTTQGTGNINATGGFDPLFVNETGGDFRLQAASPLIDAGDFNLLPTDEYDVDGDGDFLERIPLDLSGMRRESGMNVDIGSYEFQSSYYVGGSVFGLLSGNALTLQNNKADDLILDDNGAFAFSMPVEIGMDYQVSLFAPPNDPIQPCTMDFASGTIVDDDVMDVVVNCDAGDDLIFRDGF